MWCAQFKSAERTFELSQPVMVGCMSTHTCGLTPTHMYAKNILFNIIMNPIIFICAILAPLFTVGTSIPQIIKTLQIKDVTGISPHSIYVNICGNMCWLIYGLYWLDFSIIFTDFILLLFNIIRTYLYHKYKKDKKN